MKVLKFGGTSVGNPEAIRNMVDIVIGSPGSVLVISAFAGITDAIIEVSKTAVAASSGGRDEWMKAYDLLAARHRDALRELSTGPRLVAASDDVESLLLELRELLTGVAILRELSPRSLDLLMSFGERLSAVIVAAAFREVGVEAVPVDAREIIVAEGPFGNARPMRGPTARAVIARLDPLLNPPAGRPVLPVVTGFIASTESGETVTLGRGGSDYSGAILASALEADELEIWTDVDGIMTADPRKVPDAFSIDSLNYEEAMELSHFGARVIYAPTVLPALDQGIPIRIRNSFNPAFAGTIVTYDAPPSRYPVRGISSISPTTLILLQGPGMVGVSGIAARLFGAMARRNINIILISQASSERSICFAVLPQDCAPAIEAIGEEFAVEIADGRIGKPIHEDDQAIMAVVGERMRRTPGISGRIFHALGANGVNVTAMAQGSSELNVSAVVDCRDEAKALRAVHEAFFLSGVKSVNVFLVGHGLVGGTFLEQIAAHRTILFRDHSVRLNVIGVADRRKMLVDAKGLDLGAWKERLDSEGTATDLEEFARRARESGLPGTVFVDCTASEEPARLYAGLLRAAVSVVTPNKRANAGAMATYEDLMEAARESGATYLYETTVGAGLPLISTMKDLQRSGDHIQRIEAMLSGTIGYILSNYDGTASFARLVRKARELGYAEPDPRDDLGAADFARKALILAREAGFSRELADVVVEPLVDPAIMASPSLAAFYARLEAEEASFRKRSEAARLAGKRLVYAASIDANDIRIGLREAAPGEPLFGLKDAENIATFTTDRYTTVPLVVRGPGAGAAVTAGGVFADVVRVAR